MTTNQTIDGVPRVLIAQAIEFLEAHGSKPSLENCIADDLRALLDAPAPCAHEWTDDGAYLLVCTACGAQEDHDPSWRDMVTAPKDGTMVRLLVEFDEHSTEDAEQAITIGANNFDNDDEDVWRFAGWCWSHDHFTEGKGTPIGWLPMLDDPVSKSAAQPQGEPIYQLEYLGEGGGGWNDVDKATYDRFERLPNYRPRIVYAEPPAPVAANSLAMAELRHIFDSNKGADGTLVISKRLAAQILGTK